MVGRFPGARWFLNASTIEEEIDGLRRCLVGEEPTEVPDCCRPRRTDRLVPVVSLPGVSRTCPGVGARPDDIGIDYAIGDPARRGIGLGTALIAELVSSIRRQHRHAGIIADPEASNAASRRVLERNGFELLGVRPVASEPTQEPMAIYRLRPEPDVDEGG